MNNTFKRGASKQKISTKINPKYKIEENPPQNKEKDTLMFKDQSPLLYNRKNISKPIETPSSTIPAENRVVIAKNIKQRITPQEPESTPGESRRESVNVRDEEKEELRKRVNDLERELGVWKLRLREKEEIIKEKDQRLHEMEDKYKKLKDHLKKKSRPRDDDQELAFALEQIHQMENGSGSDNDQTALTRHPYGLVDFSGLMTRQTMLQNLANRMVIMQQLMQPVENQLINEVCPNPDTMSYEQLLELQEKIGYVDKGLKKEEIEKLPTIKFSRFRSKIGNNLDKCTVCQFEFEEGDTLRKLSCGHCYHKDCVDDWLTKDKKCPVCKIEVKI